VTLRAIEGRKREPCLYCGATDHPATFACQRIKAVTVYADGIYEVELREMPEPEPEGAA
jgi:hypothetical protein